MGNHEAAFFSGDRKNYTFLKIMELVNEYNQ